jgi:UDP-N-acetylglucosamine 2-epimerase (non-hydrolysing)
MKIVTVLGTRPEIIKLAPLITKLQKNNHIIFTGQHYDYSMGLRFIHELDLPKPNYALKLTHLAPSFQISEIIAKVSRILSRIKPDTVIVQGDTNTVLAGAIASLKSEIPLSHVEAGLRSYDWRMPEEHNRIVADHISELLFAPTITSKNILQAEKVHGKIYVSGNTIIDAINFYVEKASKKSKFKLNKDEFILMTLHRAENVDHKQTLSSIIKGILESKEKIIFPIHPRTKKRLKQFNLYEKLSNSKNIQLLDSVGYFDMLNLMQKCTFIITDSGGIQEEATSPKIRKKVLVTRKTTDRPEAVKIGMAEVVGVNHGQILKAIKKTIKNPKASSTKAPYGRGNASQKIIAVLKNTF